MDIQNAHSNDQASFIIRQALKAWDAQNKAITKYFDKQASSYFMAEVAPGKNRVIYILGHLVSVNDGMLPLFGISERIYPELEPIFISAPDRTIDKIPTPDELKENWRIVNEKLASHFNAMQTNDWLGPHTRVSAEDFAKEPHRNKLSILLSRTSHTSYHAGQLVLVNP